jgi:RHS repeat-associated protein
VTDARGYATDYAFNADDEATLTTNRVGTSVSGTSTATATYNRANELTSFDHASANMSTASYDGDGLRASETTGSTTQHFVWNKVTSVPLLLMDSANAYTYGPSGTPFEQINLSSGTIRYLDSDALGSVRGIVSSSGSLTASTSYDAWGNAQTAGGLTSYSPFGFAGGYTDQTSLQYLENRFYDPSTDQFMSVDPDIATTNEPYLFTNDDPLNMSDPTGQWPGESIVHKALDVIAVVPYAAYFVAYQTGRGINAVGCHFGSIGCAASKYFVLMTPIPLTEIVGLGGDVVIDAVKGKTVNHESIFDENVKGGVLPRFIDGGGPIVYLPGISKNKAGKITIRIEW